MNDTFQLTTELLNADVPALNAIVARALSRASKGFTQTVEPEEHYYQDKKQDILRVVSERNPDLAQRSAIQRAHEVADVIAGRISLGPKEARDAIVWRLVWFDSEELLSRSVAGGERGTIDSAGTLLDHGRWSREVPRKTEITTRISADEVVNALRDGHFDSRELQLIRQVMQEQLTAAQSAPERAPEDSSVERERLEGPASISAIDRDRNERIAEVTKGEVFGQKDPSLPGFRQYLRRLTKEADFTYDQKRDVCKTVNFWKSRLGVQLFYEGQPCSLKARTSGGKGGAYQLRALDAEQTSLKNTAQFPHLEVRKM